MLGVLHKVALRTITHWLFTAWTVAMPRGCILVSQSTPCQPFLHKVVFTEELQTKQFPHLSFFLLSIYFKIIK